MGVQIANTIRKLSIDEAKTLEGHLVEVGLRKLNKDFDHSKYFKKLKKATKGPLKRCYAFVMRLDDKDYDKVCEVISTFVEG